MGNLQSYFQGKQGISVSGASVDSTGHLILTLSNGSIINSGLVSGNIGPPGLGIKSAIVNSNGNLVLTMTDSSTVNTGVVIGPQGPQGPQGPSGTSIKSANVDSNGNLVLTLTDGSSINSGNVVGKQGTNLVSASIDSSGNLVLKLSDGTSTSVNNLVPSLTGALSGNNTFINSLGTNLAPNLSGNTMFQSAVSSLLASNTTFQKTVTGPQGVSGISISSANIDSSGHLVLTKSDGSTTDVGIVKGAQGAPGGPGAPGVQGTKGDQGRGITSATIDTNGNLNIVYSDGTSQTAGTLTSSLANALYGNTNFLGALTNSFLSNSTFNTNLSTALTSSKLQGMTLWCANGSVCNSPVGINLSKVWQGSTDSATNVSEISNDTGVYKQLMVVGNKSGDGKTRTVGVWDQLNVNGILNTTGLAKFGTGGNNLIQIQTSTDGSNTNLLCFNNSKCIGKNPSNGNLGVWNSLGSYYKDF